MPATTTRRRIPITTRIPTATLASAAELNAAINQKILHVAADAALLKMMMTIMMQIMRHHEAEDDEEDDDDDDEDDCKQAAQ